MSDSLFDTCLLDAEHVIASLQVERGDQSGPSSAGHKGLQTMKVFYSSIEPKRDYSQVIGILALRLSLWCLYRLTQIYSL